MPAFVKRRVLVSKVDIDTAVHRLCRPILVTAMARRRAFPTKMRGGDKGPRRPSCRAPTTTYGRPRMSCLRSTVAPALTAALFIISAGAQAQDVSKYPDWSGQWRRVEGGAPRYDHSKPYGRGQEAPLSEEYRR